MFDRQAKKKNMEKRQQQHERDSQVDQSEKEKRKIITTGRNGSRRSKRTEHLGEEGKRQA